MCTEPRPINSFLTPTLGILSGVVVLLCMGGVIMALFLRRHCIRENNRDQSSTTVANNSIANNLNNSNGSGIGARSSMVAINPRSQSLKPLIDNVECDLGAQLCAARMQADHWKPHLVSSMSSSSNYSPMGSTSSAYRHPIHSQHHQQLQSSWPVGEPPPLSLPPVMTMETTLIAPPYLTDSTMDLRSPDIIPPPSIGILI